MKKVLPDRFLFVTENKKTLKKIFCITDHVALIM